ncbi:M28 family metallopeptidase [Burkholderia thailandensis]|uniref:M28 family metallopeptidase n=1 Tax=Burkholderia thailandensis TaxID=57975 RepID=UPI00016A34E8|nr:M28 family metallopeptidase [Burkholderia thailandensis]AIP65861.1 aminopeptidase [Burkholderia thailandensis]AOI55334.1 aminopeptidase [Burkholderia thailandensis]
MSKLQQAAAAICGALCMSTVHAAPVWITLADPALHELRLIDPTATSRYSTAVATGDAKRTETVHVAQVDDSLLESLSQAIRRTRGHGPGFFVHATFEDARASLQPSAAKQAAAIDYPITNSQQVRNWISQLQASNIVSTIVSLSGFTNRYYTTSHGVAASDWIAQQWKQLAGSRTDVTVEQFTHTGWPQKSVILTIKGSDPAAGVVVIGGHLDSTVGRMTENARAPGADDNASGIASLTEALRVLLANRYQPKRTLKFIGYAAEEAGLLGSQAIAKQFRAQNVNVVGAFQLDMTNYKGDPRDIYLISDYTNSTQNTYLANLAKAYLPELSVGTSRCGYACSDHASWNAQGYPASFPFEADQNDNPYIHSTSDTLERSDSQGNHALKFGKLALAYAAELGGGLSASAKR